MGLQSRLLVYFMSPVKQSGLFAFLKLHLFFFLYLSSIELDVLHRLGAAEKHHLFYDVHLLVDVNGFVKSPIIWKENSMFCDESVTVAERDSSSSREKTVKACDD